VFLPLSALWWAAHATWRRLGFRSRHLQAGEHTLHLYERQGEGDLPPVLLIHGMGGNAAGFLPIVRGLVRACRRVTALELPGHGRSLLDSGQAPATVLQCGQGIGAALLQMPEPVVLVGSSLGGALSLFAAASLPARVRAVVGLNPAGAPLAGADRMAVVHAFRGGSVKAALEMHRRLYHRPPRLGWFFARDFGRHWASAPVQQFISEMREDLPGLGADVLGAVAQPVLILWGEGDRILPPSSVAYFREHLRNGSVELVPACGHLPMLERSRLVSARIGRFLREL
jgi:pimeloyl-ACP methyl ester carboxylesterase